MAQSFLYKYKINGVDYSDALGGAIDSAESIERIFNDASIDSNIRVFNESQITFSGKAYDYICHHLSDVCFRFDIEISNFQNFTIEGSFYSYMVTLEPIKGIASVQLKDMSWSSVLRNRTGNKIYTASKVTINCEPLEQLEKYSLPMFGVDGENVDNPDFRYGFDALQVLNYMVKSLTNNQMTLESDFLANNPIAIFNGAQLRPYNEFFPPDMPTESETYIFASLDDILTPIRKIYNLAMNIVGNVIYLTPDDDTFEDVEVIKLPSLPIESSLSTDTARLYSSVKIGSTGEMLDTKDEENEPYIAFVSSVINGFGENFLNACNCESDKSNELDLTYDIIVDPNLIHKALLNDDVLQKDDIVFIEAEWNGSFLQPKKYLSPNSNRYYYNDSFLFINVIERWSNVIANCVFSASAFEEIYRSQCGGFLETYECVNNYNLFLPGDGNFKGFLYWINPNQESPPPQNADSTDIYNGWVNEPASGTHPQDLTGGYSGYVIPFKGWYAFTAEAWLGTTLARNNLDARFSIVIYEDDTLTTEVYRTTLTKNYGAITTLYDLLEISTDTILLEAGNVVLVQTDIDVDSDTPNIGQMVWEGVAFYYDTSRMGCIDYRTNPNTRPYVYEFDFDICYEDYQKLVENRLGYISIGNNKAWISKISRNLSNQTSLRLVSNDVICKPCN